MCTAWRHGTKLVARIGGRFQVWELILVEAGVLRERVPIVLVFHKFVYPCILGVASLPSTYVSLGPFTHDVRHGRHNSVSQAERFVIHELFLAEEITCASRSGRLLQSS